MRFKTGLLPAPEPPALKFGAYMTPTLLPSVPAVFGHQGLIPRTAWFMYMNDRLGCCTVSGADHVVRLWNLIAGRRIRFTDADVSEDYFAITGGSDTGADMVAVAKYWTGTGFRDSRANRHKIVAYVAVDPSKLDRVFAASYLFDGGCGLGVQVRQSDEDRFVAGLPWVGDATDDVIGYHYVPLLGRLANGNGAVVTWGAEQEVEISWLEQNLREVVAVISQEAMISAKSAEGFDFAALQDDLDAIGT